ncbi:LTA synthase family protein [Allopusillimonas soli]|nr:LTA synthase family protein [Allopusillimonas soli]
MSNLALAHLLEIFGAGLIYDLAAAAWFLIPLALLAAIIPDTRVGRRVHAVAASLGCLALLAAILFTAVAEFLFWNEFSSRFNFIAVDYLVYTREVLGNIEESYHVNLILSCIAIATVLIAWPLRRRFWSTASAAAGNWKQRTGMFLAILLLPAASYFLVNDTFKTHQASASASQLAGNGDYELFRAFRDNKLDYRRFYKVLPEAQAKQIMRTAFTKGAASAHFLPDARNPLARSIIAAGPERRLNVVLVSMESMGADYLASFGGQEGLTPNLDRLAREGMMFTQTYATGLRTVRGLEALTLSMPPTPGHAVVMRKNNKGFQTLGQVFREHGYDSLYLYGGYSYFDNMKDFFGGNGYAVIDRMDMPDDQISHETIWGVADEDLFRKTLQVLDARTADGRKVFAHVMTTSNHRPYTYPEGRIDIPSGSGRAGAVKYADWAIGQFVEQAARHAWFKDTIFVFVADHTSHGRGRTDLPPEAFHIPLIIWSPANIHPQRIDTLASQIDVGPTLLSLLHFSYTSQFFGQDILAQGRNNPRALMANYQTVGLLESGMVVELSPRRQVRVLDAINGKPRMQDPQAGRLVDEAIGYYQVASGILRNGGLLGTDN